MVGSQAYSNCSKSSSDCIPKYLFQFSWHEQFLEHVELLTEEESKIRSDEGSTTYINSVVNDGLTS